MERYVVLGTIPDITAWRRERGIPFRNVTAVSTTQGHLATRGLSGDFTVVRLPSWSRASERVRADVDQNLALAAHTRTRKPCCVCGRPGADVVIHLMPLAAGGSPDDPANQGSAHRSCAA